MSDSQQANSVARDPRVIFSTSSIFPFQLLPDSVIIDEEKTTIISRFFPFSKQVDSIPYEYLMGAKIQMNLLFAQFDLELSMGMMEEEPPSVPFLNKKDAKMAQRLVTGLILLNKDSSVDLTEYSVGEIRKLAMDVGSS